MTKKQIDARQKVVRDLDKKAAWSEAIQLRNAALRKTDQLRALRLEKEAADRLEQKDQPVKTARKKPARSKRA